MAAHVLLLSHSIAQLIHPSVAPDSRLPSSACFSRCTAAACDGRDCSPSVRRAPSLPSYADKLLSLVPLLAPRRVPVSGDLRDLQPSTSPLLQSDAVAPFSDASVRTPHCIHKTHSTNTMMSTIHELYKFRETCAATTKPSLRSLRRALVPGSRTNPRR